MGKRVNLIVWIISICFLAASFWVIGNSYMDPDLGLHLAPGKYLWENRMLPKEDMYSYTRQDHLWRDHEWSANVAMYLIWSTGGDKALLFGFVLGAILGLILLVNNSGQKFVIGSINSLFSLAVFVLCGMTLLPYFGSRPQVWGWTFWSILLVLFSKLERRYENKYMISAVMAMALWANFHGSFVLGLALWGLILISHSVSRQYQKVAAYFLGLLSAVFAIAILNPYGTQVLSEVLLTASDSQLRWRIYEWMPMTRIDPTYILVSALLFSFLYFFRDKFQWWEKVAAGGIFIASLISNRHIPLFAILALPLLLRAVYLLGDHRGLKINIRKLSWGMYGVVVILSVNQIFSTQEKLSWLSLERFYPETSLVFLQHEPAQSRVFNYYGWGGYLIWKLPGRKWFIDGRMPSWPGIFDEYSEVANGTDKGYEILQKYSIDMILWPAWRGADQYRLENGNYIKHKRDVIDLVTERGWRKTHEDSVSQIWKK
jgi:hypothetical protein